jgi:hypothetical protein
MNSKLSFCTWWLFVWFFSIFSLLFSNFISTLNSMHDPFYTIPSTNPLTPKFKIWLIFISMFFYCMKIMVLFFLQNFIQKMCISANSRGLWGDNHAIVFWQIIHIGPSIFGQKNCAICFWTSDVFISNSTLKLLYHDDMVKARNGHYELIIFYNASWEIDQNIPTNK